MFCFSATKATDPSTLPVSNPKKDFIYETKEEAKHAFKELLKEKVLLDDMIFDFSFLRIFFCIQNTRYPRSFSIYRVHRANSFKARSHDLICCI